MKVPAETGPPTAIGAPVMAIGIFGVAALQNLPSGPSLTKPFAAILALAWAMVAFELVVSLCRGRMPRHTEPLVDSFGIGTWVAATAVVARILMLAAPSQLWAARSLYFVAAAIWLWFIPLALRHLTRLAVDRNAKPSGVILLMTVATEAVALMGLRLFPNADAMRWSAVALIGFGVVCYLAGLFLILRRYAGHYDWHIPDDWDSTNCILHGALSITGLTAVTSSIFRVADLLALWIGAVAVFAIIELIEVARLWMRVKALGWRRAIFEYDISQWARNFTFGMFYAFTLAISERLPELSTHPILQDLSGTILAYGQYVVIVLLAAETLLLLFCDVARHR